MLESHIYNRGIVCPAVLLPAYQPARLALKVCQVVGLFQGMSGLVQKLTLQQLCMHIIFV